MNPLLFTRNAWQMASFALVLLWGGVSALQAQLVLSVVGESSSINDELYLVDLGNKTSSKMTDLGIGRTNGLAWDEANKVAYFSSQDQNGTLFMWDALSNQVTVVAGSLGATSINSGTFYDGAYWFISNNSSNLVKVEVDLSDRTSPSFSAGDVTTYSNFNGGSITYTFGDISVDENGILFGTNTAGSNRLFSVDISATGSGGNPTNYINSIGGISGSLQIGYDLTTSTMYAVNTNGSEWSVMDTTDASLTPILDGGLPFAGPVGGLTRDVSQVIVKIPEPSSLGTLFLTGAYFLIRRRRCS